MNTSESNPTSPVVQVLPVGKIPRANRNAAHFILTAARVLRTQSNDANLHRLAKSLVAIAHRLRGMDEAGDER